MSSKIIDSLEPAFQIKIYNLINRLRPIGITILATSGRRTIAEQDKLYASGRTKAGKIVTKAKGGESPHNFGLACDVCPVNPKDNTLWWGAPDDVWNAMHRVGEELGLRAGYDFKSIKDSPHFEDPRWKEAQALWREGKLHVI